MGVHSWEEYGFRMGKIWVFDLKPIFPGKKTSGSGKKLSKSSNFGAITGTKAVCGSLGISSMKGHLL